MMHLFIRICCNKRRSSRICQRSGMVLESWIRPFQKWIFFTQSFIHSNRSLFFWSPTNDCIHTAESIKLRVSQVQRFYIHVVAGLWNICCDDVLSSSKLGGERRQPRKGQWGHTPLMYARNMPQAQKEQVQFTQESSARALCLTIFLLREQLSKIKLGKQLS